MPSPRTTQQSGRPRTPLDRERIMDAALRLAASGEADAVSVRKLGAELGADPTAIYRHFRGMDDLILALLDRLLADTAAATARDVGWRQHLTDVAQQTLDVFVHHPAIGLELGSRSTNGPGERDVIEAVLASLSEAGLQGAATVRYYGMYTSYIISFTSAMSAGVLSGADPGMSGRWVGDLGYVDARQHPMTATLRDELSELTDGEVFSSGVRAILDAVADAARSGSPSSSRSRVRRAGAAAGQHRPSPRRA